MGGGCGGDAVLSHGAMRRSSSGPVLAQLGRGAVASHHGTFGFLHVHLRRFIGNQLSGAAPEGGQEAT